MRKKIIIIWTCTLVCFLLFTGCTAGKKNDDTSGDIIYSFRDPDNTDSIVVTPRE